MNINKLNSEKFSKDFLDKKKNELNIPTDFKVVGIVARLVQEKGYLDLFEAFKSVLQIFPKTILLVVGAEEPEKEDAISPEVVRDYGIEKNVIFLGEREDVEEIYPLMDAFILPSYREGLPVSLLEAMAEKRPVVASDIRGCREEIDNEKNGILVPVKNPEKRLEAIIYFFNNAEFATEMGESGREKVIREFDERRVFGRIKIEYQRLIDEKLG